jgi:tetratricopeptide (TPR) repeat protein
MLPEWALLLLFAASDPNLQKAEQALARGDCRDALNQLSAVPARDARWHLLASKAHDGLNEPTAAVAEAEEALRLEPRNPAHHIQLAQIFLSRNTPGAALEILTEAESMFPDTFLIRLGKGLAEKELQLYEPAERDLLWCLSRQPLSALAFDALGTIYIQQLRFSEARRLSEEFLKRDPSDYRGYYFLAAGREGDLLPTDETTRLLAESIQRRPSFAAAHALMGKVLLRQHKAREAAEYLKKAVELRPDLVQAHLHLARALRLLGDETAAAREFEAVRQLKAKEQEPAPSLLYHRGSR